MLKTEKFMKINLKFLLLVLHCSIVLNTVYAQSDRFVSGKLLDAKTNEPIPFATLILKNHQLGLITNAQGDFYFNNNSDYETDILIITCIGYKKKTIKFKNLSSKEVNIITLSPAIHKLKEVIVTPSSNRISARKIVRKAIKNIPNNYPVKPYSFVSYYRDYQKKDKEYQDLNEAIIQTIDYGFNTNYTSNEYRLLNYKENSKFPRNNTTQLYDNKGEPDHSNPNKYMPNFIIPNHGGNELFILLAHDAIRNFKINSFSYIYNFSKEFLRNHTFSKIEPTYNNDLLLYKIGFKTDNTITGDSIIASGDIYIQPEDFSIHRIDYSCLNKTNGKKMYNLRLEYQYDKSMDSLMILKYISFNNIFYVIDTSDDTYFRILSGNKSNSILRLVMSNIVDPKSANNRRHYTFMLGDKKLVIRNIIVKANIIKVIFNYYSRRLIENSTEKLNVSVKNIKDIDGKVINQRRKLEFYQYRELFVQEYNKRLQFEDSCYLKNIPLLQNRISKYKGNQKYWMNTPEKINVENK